MKTLITLTLATLLMAAPLAAHADDTTPSPKGGTLKGAAVGGLAGHALGHHTKTGVVAGAMIGHHEKAKSEKRISAGQQP